MSRVRGHLELQFDLASYDYREATYEQVYYYVCDTCALTSDWQFIEDEARKKLEALIRRFPPLMRVWPGDLLQLAGLEGLAVVVSVDRDNGKSILTKAVVIFLTLSNGRGNLNRKKTNDIRHRTTVRHPGIHCCLWVLLLPGRHGERSSYCH